MDEIETTASRQLNIIMLQQQLGTHLFGIGDRLVFLPTVDSTNTQAMRLALNGSEEGVVVLTDNQTAGKGRLGRQWVDKAGCNVLSSMLLRPQFPPYLLVMIASLAVVEAIHQSCSITANIKWPNDILIGQQKVAGILIETSHDRTGQMVAIMGIGVNVNGHISQADGELQTRATTLETECGHTVSRELFIIYLLQHLETNYLALQQTAPEPVGAAYGVASRLIREQWRAQLSTLGRTIEVQQGDAILSGVAEDVNEVGELLLRNHSGELVSITWGDVGYPTE